MFLRPGQKFSPTLRSIFVILLVFIFSGIIINLSNEQGDEWLKVKRVIDGDTLLLENNQRVRLIGVDTPEIHLSHKLYRDAHRSKRDIETIRKLGLMAKDFVKRLVDNKLVRLEYDVERQDRYGRILAYVYLEDGTFLNAEIIKEGFGQIMTVPPNVKYSKLFLRLQQDARRKNKGLWGVK